ncbi:MAG: hypothetical protein QOH92_1080 [Chloroflexota bacterium]|jgi:hypothetical protein|nr:hypothetical protein [Chloroflexota bacterium]
MNIAAGTTIPANLVHHLLQTGGGGVSIVVGAGTSMEVPTSLKSASQYALKAHTELVAEGVILEGACPRPDDLAQVADAVFIATGSQVDVVLRLPQNEFRTARPNRGHLIAVACLLERAVSAVITLNYDMSFAAAITELGGGDRIGIIEGPEDGTLLRLTNLFFLHRSAHRPAEEWIMRSVSLEESWKGGWEELVTAQIGGSPVVLFAGLGTPVPVLVATVKRVRGAYPGGQDRIFLAGPGAAEDSDFAAALNLAPANYIQLKWSLLMYAAASHLVRRMCGGLLDAARVIEHQRAYPSGPVAETCARLQQLDLVDLGKLRAAWLLSSEPYQVEVPGQSPLLADILLGIALIEGHVGLQARFAPTGIVALAGDQRESPTVAFASGSGHLNWLTVEAKLNNRLAQLPAGTPRPGYAVVSAVHGGRVQAASPPDIVRDAEEDSIIFERPLTMLDMEEVRANSELAEKLVA